MHTEAQRVGGAHVRTSLSPVREGGTHGFDGIHTYSFVLWLLGFNFEVFDCYFLKKDFI